MTFIAGFSDGKNAVLGADYGYTDKNVTVINESVPKIFKGPNFLIGFAGPVVHGLGISASIAASCTFECKNEKNICREILGNIIIAEAANKVIPNFRFDSSNFTMVREYNFIIAYQGKIFRILEDNFCFCCDYGSIGRTSSDMTDEMKRLHGDFSLSLEQKADQAIRYACSKFLDVKIEKDPKVLMI